MISISNLFIDEYINDNTNEIGLSQSLDQGKKFKKYHSKIKNNLKKEPEILSRIEGFSYMNLNNNLNTQTTQTYKVINTNDYSNQEKTIDNLRKEYNQSLQEYEKLSNEISSNASSTQKQILDQLKSKMNMLSKQIIDLTNKFQTGLSTVEQQANQNRVIIDKYFEDLNNINNKISEDTNRGVENILKDSDIVVLQKNYEYLFWSILAIGTVLVSINVVKKE